MGEHGINSAHTLYSGQKPNKNPLALAGHVEGWGVENNAREAEQPPVPAGRAVQDLVEWQHRPDAGILGPYFVSRGCVPTREGRVVTSGIKLTLSWHMLPPHLYSPVEGENDHTLRSNEKVWGQMIKRTPFKFIIFQTCS